ncbi:MAG: hypothetical protein AAB447_01850 [Patescibacteria group bacterium]
MFSSFDPDNPYRRMKDIADAQEEVVRETARLFCKGSAGHTMLERVARREMSVEIGLEKIRKMLRNHANSIAYRQ